MYKDNGTKEMIANHELWYIKPNVWCSVVPILIIEERERGCDFPCQPLCHEICGTYCGWTYNWRCIFKISKACVYMCCKLASIRNEILVILIWTEKNDFMWVLLFREEQLRTQYDWKGNVW